MASATGTARWSGSGARSRRPARRPSHDAHFACALAIAWPNDGQVENFEGRVDGTLVWPPRGDKGFGYDPDLRPGGPGRHVRRDGPGGKAPDQPSRGRLPEAGESDAVTTEPLALYVHWPFCVSKCPYCDFNSHVRSSIDQDEWRDALLADLAHEASLLPGRTLTSIFFGGGTPSLMEPATTAAIIGAAQNPLAGGRRHRDHAGGQSQLGRSGPLRRPRGRRRQPPVAGPAELRRRQPCLPRPRAFVRRGTASPRRRAEAFSARQLRPDLRACRAKPRQAGRRPSTGRWPKARRTSHSTN